MTSPHDGDENDVLAAEDSDIGPLLRGAYDAPPVPKRLLARITVTASQQWGASAQLAPDRPAPRIGTASRLLRSSKIWSAAACLIIALAASFAYLASAQAYSWAAVVEALSKQPVVQLRPASTGQSQTAWLSISAKKAGEQSESVIRLYDLVEGQMLERGASDSQARRFRLPKTTTDADPQRLVLSFLTGDFGAVGGGQQRKRARVVDEGWSRVADGVELRMKLAGDSPADDLRLALTIDPKTHLPKRVVVHDQRGNAMDNLVSYPQEQVEQLIARSFPAEITIVDVASVTSAANTAIASSANTATSHSIRETPATPLAGAAS